MNKIFAIGDIHGELEKLKAVVSFLEDKDGTIVFLGDYIDRGPNSKEVVDLLIYLQRQREVVCLMGNHEQMLMDYLSGINKRLYLLNGGNKTVESYGGEFPEEHVEFFRSLLPHYETDDYIFVHAGIVSGRPLDLQGPDIKLWIRRDFIGSDDDFGKVVVFGHTPVGALPLIEDNKIGIDTGAGFEGPLTCIELPSKKIFQI